MTTDPRVSQSTFSTYPHSRLSVPKGALTPCPRSNTPLTEVLDRCLSLKHDLGFTLKTLQTSRNPGLISLNECRRDLDSPLRIRWNSSDKYKEIKERIRQKEVEERLHGLMPDLQNPRETGLLTARNRRKTKLITKNSRLSTQINARMIGAFLLAECLSKPRDFGAAVSMPKTHKNVETEEMEQFWRAEIDKYEKQRTKRLIQPAIIRKNRGSEVKPDLQIETNLSPLQLFVMNSARRIKGDEQFATVRRMRIAEKMRTIQPSAEVQALSLKYLPKHFQSTANLHPVNQQLGECTGLAALLRSHKHRKHIST